MSKSAQHQLPHERSAKNRSLQAKAGDRAPAALRRTWTPVVVQGVKFKERITISPKDYHRLDIDPTYQRGRTSMIPLVIKAIQSGGSVPDLIDLAERPWDAAAKGKLYIMDGYQRACALEETNLTFQANVYTSESILAERSFFLAKNNRKALNSNVQVRAWTGPVTKLLQQINLDRDSPMFGRIEFEHAGGDKINAAILVRGMTLLLSEARHMGDIQKCLDRVDKLLVTGQAIERAKLFIRLIGLIFVRGYAKTLPVAAIAIVASQRWRSDKECLPVNSIIKKIAGINWTTAVPSNSLSNLDIAVTLISRHWK